MVYGDDDEHECQECRAYTLKHNRLDETCLWYDGKVKVWKPNWKGCGLFEPLKEKVDANEQT